MSEIVKIESHDYPFEAEVFEQICFGNLNLGPEGKTKVRCAVLENETRVISSNSTFKAFGRPAHGRRKNLGEEQLPPILTANNLKPFFTEQTRKIAQLIFYRHTNGTISSGYDAQIIPEICDIYEDAYEAGVLQKHTQEPIIPYVKAVRRVLSRIGITALVDEATGYQYIKEEREFQKLLDRIISSEYRPWTKQFPLPFFKEIYRLYDWDWELATQNQKHDKYGQPKKPQTPSCVGNFINKYIYNALGEEVLKKLKEVNPKNKNGNRPRRFTSHLSEDVGIPALQNRITRVLTVMQLSKDIDEFTAIMDKMDQTDRPSLLPQSN